MHYPGMHILSPGYKAMMEPAQETEPKMTTTTAKTTGNPMPNAPVKRTPSQKYYIISKDADNKTTFFSSEAYTTLAEAERKFENVVKEYKPVTGGTKATTTVFREDGDKNKVLVFSLTGLKPFHLYIYKDDGSDPSIVFPTKPSDFNDQLRDYQEWTKTTGGKHFNIETSLVHWVMGAVGEATEVLEAIRMNQSTDLLVKEMGDVLYYLCMASNTLASRLSYVEPMVKDCVLPPVDGVTVSAGKAIEMMKKYLSYPDQEALNRQQLFDCFNRAYIYLSKLCDEKNISMSTVMEENKKKLIAKYPGRDGGFLNTNFVVVKLGKGVY